MLLHVYARDLIYTLNGRDHIHCRLQFIDRVYQEINGTLGYAVYILGKETIH